MAKMLHEWIESDVQPFRDPPVAWLSLHDFFQDAMRPTYSDLSCFFSPADEAILDQRTVRPAAGLLQIADYDVDCIAPLHLKQHQPVVQNERLSQVRHGARIDLIVPLSNRFGFVTVQHTGDPGKAGIDPIVEVTRTTRPEKKQRS